MITREQMKMNEEYKITDDSVLERREGKNGDVVVITGFDCDGWPEFKNYNNGNRNCIPTAWFLNSVELNDTEKNQWMYIVVGTGSYWQAEQDYHSTDNGIVATEEEAKGRVENNIKMFGGTGYIAKVDQVCKKSDVIWK